MESFDVKRWSDALKEQTQQWEEWFKTHPNLIKVKHENAWSPEEVLEHLALVETGVRKRLKTSLVQLDAPEKLGEGKIKHILVNKRAMKVDSPELLKPRNTWNHWEETLQAFKENRDALVQDLETGTIVPASMGMVHPRLGEMSVTDWLYFIHSHAERHWHQVQEVTAQ